MGREKETDETNRVVNLRLVQDGFWDEILKVPRYANIVRSAFENGDEIIERSNLINFCDKLKIKIKDYDSTVIGSFEVWSTEGDRPSHRTVYITQIDLPNGEHLYPLISQKGLKQGGVDPSLLVAKKYE